MPPKTIYLPIDKQNPSIGDIINGSSIGRANRQFVWTECNICHDRRWARWSPLGKAPMPTTCKSCIQKGKVKELSSQWKGGRFLDSQGYWEVCLHKDDFFYPMRSGKRYIKEHRLVMAKHLGRCLAPFEVVHHKNGDKSDNRIENLELGTFNSHSKDHAIGYRDGYKKGLIDGKSAKITMLENKIIELENLLNESRHV